MHSAVSLAKKMIPSLQRFVSLNEIRCSIERNILSILDRVIYDTIKAATRVHDLLVIANVSIQLLLLIIQL